MAHQWPTQQLDELLARSLAMEDYAASSNHNSSTSSGPRPSSSSNHNSSTKDRESSSEINPLPLPTVPNPVSLPLTLRRYVEEQSIVNLTDDITAVNPDVFVLFQKYNYIFFDGKLSGCELKWSKRMTLCAGLCCYEGRGGLCSIKLSSPLLQYRSTKETVETLIHEMIHAFLFVTVRDRDRDGHGPSFQSLMNVINYTSGLNISIYHTFHDEVDAHRKHVWKCNGRCQSKPPHFGIVKRAMNRAPGPNDSWYSRHQQQCGGEWTKISEPKEFTEKQRKKKERQERKKQRELDKANGITRSKAKTAKTTKKGGAKKTRKGTNKTNGKKKENPNPNGRTLLDMFGGNTKALDSEGTPKKKRLKVEAKDEEDDIEIVPNVKSNGARNRKLNEKKMKMNTIDDDGDIEILPKMTTTSNGASSETKERGKFERVFCPICGKMVVESKINEHLDSCLS